MILDMGVGVMTNSIQVHAFPMIASYSIIHHPEPMSTKPPNLILGIEARNAAAALGLAEEALRRTALTLMQACTGRFSSKELGN